jgi:hypothetical protein
MISARQELNLLPRVASRTCMNGNRWLKFIAFIAFFLTLALSSTESSIPVNSGG